MLIIANTLVFNGGSTFVLRFCRESFKNGKKLGVLILNDNVENNLLHELKKFADVYFLSSYIKPSFRLIIKGPLGGFLPYDIKSISNVFYKHGGVVHVMGVFGLLFVSRCVKKSNQKIKISVGVYHQNEFMFTGVDYYFSKEAHRLFAGLGEQGVVFFNETNKVTYSQFFGVDYSRSLLVPIGVELPSLDKRYIGSHDSRRIISIGNLLNFKTYNQHIINCMPDLLSVDPLFRYEIYGEGPYEQILRELAVARGVSESVEFKGKIPYSEFSSVLDGAFLFVGSGTAIVEAAALGIPALIGIESTQQPITYGFLSDVEGFSYNELDHGKAVFSIFAKITQLIKSQSDWEYVAYACKEKSKSFSIKSTVYGFEAYVDLLPILDSELVGGYRNVRALRSLMMCALNEKVSRDPKFSGRRNQGAA